ncbi:acetyl-CoA C-acetyltransferase [Paeniglutamicibacter psychrophenolicus]|uniref:Probable acetyl-CoA acetyltransferase n=1 Tax=Paeniglutamicibacter psychrophenolicus TaxID=257454 RepID=A0ABS4W9L5_9MICC|nr:acetyl-CoA C-acyltransferase [Paeniglutamicibacter psychrophenolicus]MBP2372890.1 acetyl-CoA C-acetyltransferase [Paeniglutamicibacter psychrophenolicus]
MSNRIPVLVSAARTAIGKFNGIHRNTSALDLGAEAAQGALRNINGYVPDTVFMGNVVQAGNGQNPARSVAVRAGLPLTVPAMTLNNVCLASLYSATLASTLIRAGQFDSALVGGFESMSRALHGLQMRQAVLYGQAPAMDLLESDGLRCAITDQGMGPISDESNARLSISRAVQDSFAAESHRRAASATSKGRFAREMALKGASTFDEGPRPATTADILGQLNSAFTPGGTITAGNASQMSDAGAAGVVMEREKARQLGLDPIVEIVDSAVVAGPDTSLHLKPADAIRKLLARNGLATNQIGLWEINEAFAGVVVASVRDLGIDLESVNVNGGAIALGHPLGASGFRLLQTLAVEMQERQVEYGVAAICGGGGQGQAVLLRLP